MRISEGENYKLKKLFESNCESITIRFKFSHLHGEDVIALTKSQIDRLVEAYDEKKSMTIKMSKTQKPASGKWFETVENGLYLLKQGGLYDGREIIAGPNSPFKNIPILGMILSYFFQKKISYTLINGNWWNWW